MYVLNSSICLIGMPGSGKSTLGRELGMRYNLPFKDLDELIGDQIGMSVNLFWNASGEAQFRIFERNQLFKLFTQKPSIISTGGGTPCFFDNMALIQSRSFSIYLQISKPPSSDYLVSGNHPMFPNKGDFEESWVNLLKKREPFYKRADSIQKAFLDEPNVLSAVSKICFDNGLIQHDTN